MNAATLATSDTEATAWHALNADDVVRRLNTDAEKGLDAAEVAERLKKYGKNRLPEAAKRGPFLRFLMQFNNVLVYVLLAAGRAICRGTWSFSASSDCWTRRARKRLRQ